MPGRARRWLWLGAAPIAIYTVCFAILTWPNILCMRRWFLCDYGDGLQNVWNVWWVDYAVTTLHASPWFTTYLHHPHGTSLLGHTLNPLNGFLAIPLLRVFPLAVAYNLVFVFAFVMSGTTAFWLAHRVTDGAYWPSLVAGYIFTFSAYHWGHGRGHMQLTAMQWIPLFVLLWIDLLKRPSIWLALSAAGALLAVELCDFYYLFYCVVGGAILFFAEAVRRRRPLFFAEKRLLIALATFVVASAGLCLPLAIALMRLNAGDPLQGFHPPDLFSTDLLAPIIPSAQWRFGGLTKAFWSGLPGNDAEASVSLGIAAIAAGVYAIVAARRKDFALWTWVSLGAVFFVLSLGRRLQVWGKPLTGALMPYAGLEKIFPPMQLSGCPSRMMVMTTLAVAVLAAIGITRFVQLHRDRRWFWPVAGVFLVALIIESIPMPMPTMPADVPNWALRLRDMPNPGDSGVFFVNTPSLSPSDQILSQTIHHKPMVLGYIARTPLSVAEKDQQIIQTLLSGRLDKLRDDENVRYIITDGTEAPGNLRIVYQLSGRRIYDLGPRVK